MTPSQSRWRRLAVLAGVLSLPGCTLEHVTAPGRSRWDLVLAPKPVHVHTRACRPAPVVSTPVIRGQVLRSCQPEPSPQEAPSQGPELAPVTPPVLLEPTPIEATDPARGAGAVVPTPPLLSPTRGARPVRYASHAAG